MNTVQDKNIYRGLDNLKSMQKSKATSTTSLIKITQTTWPIRFEISQPKSNFIGREEEISELLNMINNKGTSFIVISGPGGIGKTELTLAVANQLCFKNQKTSSTLLLGNSDSSLKDSLNELAKHIGISLNGSTADTFKRIVETITKNSNYWVLIIDNLDELNETANAIFKTFQKHFKSQATVIITSRSANIIHGERKLLKLSELQNNEAEKFVMQSLAIQTCNNNVKQLCKVKQNFPLALEQAVNYIMEQREISVKGTSYGISDYLKEFESETDKVLNYKLCNITKDYDKTVFSSVNEAVDKLKTSEPHGKIAVELLKCLAYLNPDCVFVEVFYEIYSDVNPRKIDEALSLIKSQSLVKIEKSIISINKMVQQVIKLKVASNKAESAIIERIVIGLMQIIRKQPDFTVKRPYSNNYEVSNILINDLISVWTFGANCDGKLLEQLKNIPNDVTKILIFRSHPQMLQFCETNLAKMSQLFGPTDIEVLKMEKNIAHIQMEKPTTCKSSLQKLQEILKQLRNPYPRDEITSTDVEESIVQCLAKLGKTQESINLWKKVLSSKKNLLGENHSETMETKENLASYLKSLNKIKEAIELQKEVLQWKERHLGERHEDTLVTLKKLADWLKKDKNYSEAKHLYEKYLQQESNETSRIFVKEKLAETLDELDEPQEAVKLFEEVFIWKNTHLNKQDKNMKITQEKIKNLKAVVAGRTF